MSSWRRIALVALVLVLHGCAYVHVDAEGTRHAVGLMYLTLEGDSAGQAGESLRSRSVGVTLIRAEAGSAFVVGYSDATVGFLHDNSVVLDQDLLTNMSNAKGVP